MEYEFVHGPGRYRSRYVETYTDNVSQQQCRLLLPCERNNRKADRVAFLNVFFSIKLILSYHVLPWLSDGHFTLDEMLTYIVMS